MRGVEEAIRAALAIGAGVVLVVVVVVAVRKVVNPHDQPVTATPFDVCRALRYLELQYHDAEARAKCKPHLEAWLRERRAEFDKALEAAKSP